MKTQLFNQNQHKSVHRWIIGALALAVLTACGGGGSDSVAAEELTADGRRAPNKGKNTTTTTTTTTTTNTTETSTSGGATSGNTTTTDTSTAPSTTTSSGNTSTSGSTVAVPMGPFACATGAITCVEVTSTANTTQASVPVTFGQPFRAGDWQHTTQGLVAKVDEVAVPLQADEISSHRDGSARFAVLSAQLNNLQPGQTKIINLYTGSKTINTANVPANPDWNLELEAQVYDSNGNVVANLVVQPQAQLAAQIASGAGRRLTGAVANEYTVALPFKDKTSGIQHPHLTARLHTRLVDGGQRIRTDVVMENTRTWTPNPGNITYSFAVKRNGSTLYTQPKFTHYHHARWHKVLWTGASAEPQARVRHNMPYFMASKAVWNYDLKVVVSETALARDYTRLATARADQAVLGPMGNMLLEKYFPTTGSRDEIGPYPRWTVNYLLSQDYRALEVMMANADAAASVPVHYRDEDTGYPLDLDRYPNVSITPEWSTPKLPTMTNGTTIWTPDVAHQGSFAYVPYLLTGDAFYQDEMMYWTSWNAASTNPAYRGSGLGLAKDNQVRGQAWAMRSLGETYRALPDNHPRKSYFDNRLKVNLDWYANAYPRNPNSSSLYPLNALPKPDQQEYTGPWQNDFFGVVMGQLAELKEPGAYEVLEWVSKFNVGRFMAEDQGFCTAYAAGYFFLIKDSSGKPYTTWRDLFQANFPGETCSPNMAIAGYPGWAGGYAAGARAVLASAHNGGIAGANSVYAKWRNFTSAMDADIPNDPTWAIVPR